MLAGLLNFNTHLSGDEEVIPIVVSLFPSTTPGVQGHLGAGRMDGVLAEGAITAADLVGPLAGHPFVDQRISD